MSYNYAGVKSKADTLIKKFGQSVTFYKVARGAYNPASGYSAHTAESYSATIVLFKQPKEEFSEQAVQGKLVKAIASSATEPKIGHTVDVNSEKYRVLKVEPLQPAATVIYYELQLAS